MGFILGPTRMATWKCAPRRCAGWVRSSTRRSAPLPLTKAGHNWYQYRESRSVPTEEQAQSDTAKLDLRAEAIEEGKITPEEFDKGFEATPGAWCLELYKSLESLMEQVTALSAYCDEKFGEAAPEFGTLHKSLEEVHPDRPRADETERRHGGTEEPEAEPEAEPEEVEAAAVRANPAAAAPRPAARRATAGAEPASRDEAVERVLAAARYLRKENPFNAGAYLIARGLRWGELRATGSNPHPAVLVAPPTEVRVRPQTTGRRGRLGPGAGSRRGCGRPAMGPGLAGPASLRRHGSAELGPRGAARAILSGLKALLAEMP